MHLSYYHRLQLQAFNHIYLRTVGHICWTDKAKSLADIIQQARLRWLGHVLRMDEKRLTQKVMFATRGTSWMESRGGQQLTWQSNKKIMVAGACLLPSWGPRDSPHQCLSTLQDMARNRQ